MKLFVKLQAWASRPLTVGEFYLRMFCLLVGWLIGSALR